MMFSAMSLSLTCFNSFVIRSRRKHISLLDNPDSLMRLFMFDVMIARSVSVKAVPSGFTRRISL